MNYTIEEIIELAQEVEIGDSIDWSTVRLDKNRVYQIIGSQVCEYYSGIDSNQNKEAIMLASLTKLVVENFVLNVKLESGEI